MYQAWFSRPTLFSLVHTHTHLSLLSLQPLSPQGTRLHSFSDFGQFFQCLSFSHSTLHWEEDRVVVLSSSCLCLPPSCSKRLHCPGKPFIQSFCGEAALNVGNEDATPAADVDRKGGGRAGEVRRNGSGVAAWKLVRCSTCSRCLARVPCVGRRRIRKPGAKRFCLGSNLYLGISFAWRNENNEWSKCVRIDNPTGLHQSEGRPGRVKSVILSAVVLVSLF